MSDNEHPAGKAMAPEPAEPTAGGVVIDLRERRLQVLRESVEKTRTKLKKLERRLIRGELKKGRLRQKLRERQLALSDLEQRLAGAQGQTAANSQSRQG
jgi:hypothetical protein